MRRTSTWEAAVSSAWMLGAVGCGAAGGEPTRVYVPVPMGAPCPSAPATPSASAPDAPVRPPPPPSAGPAAGVLQPRSFQCEAVGDRQSVTFRRSPDGTHYVGSGTDHYDMARFGPCPASNTNEIRCEGAWQFDYKPAALRVILQADGVVRGELTRSSGEVAVMSCLASVNDLRTP